MRPNIDVEKSIEKEQLVSKFFFHKFLDFFNPILFSIVFILMILKPIKGVSIEISTTNIFLIILAIIITVLGSSFFLK
jgi:hypothetical protein